MNVFLYVIILMLLCVGLFFLLVCYNQFVRPWLNLITNLPVYSELFSCEIIFMQMSNQQKKKEKPRFSVRYIRGRRFFAGTTLVDTLE